MTTTVEAFLSACAAENGPAALAVLTPAAEERFLEGRTPLESCEEVLRVGLNAARPSEAAEALRSAEVRTLEASGGYGRAELVTGGRRVQLELSEVRGTWQLYHPG